MKHTIAVIVENKSGVLTRIAGLFSRRSFNIDSLSVGGTDNPDYSRMTITVHGDKDVLEQVICLGFLRLHHLVDSRPVEFLPFPQTWCLRGDSVVPGVSGSGGGVICGAGAERGTIQNKHGTHE